MVHPILLYLSDRTQEALRHTLAGRLQRYPDKERQPRVARHWLNR